jgi:catalase
VREKIDRENNFKQAGERYRAFEDWERDDLITNLVNTLASANKIIQDKMIHLFTQCDADYGRRVAEGLQKVAGQNISKGPLGTTSTEQAVQEAIDVSHEAKPY